MILEMHMYTKNELYRSRLTSYLTDRNATKKIIHAAFAGGKNILIKVKLKLSKV